MADEDTVAPVPEEDEEDAEPGEEKETPPDKKPPVAKPDEEEEEEEEEADEDDPSKVNVPVRSSAVASHIIARQKKKIDDLRNKKKDDEDEGTDEEGEEGEDDEELSPRALRAIQSGISKAVAPLAARLATDADEKELDALLLETPEAQKYEKRIRAFMGHDGYRNVPAEVIYHHLAWNDAQKIGAKKKDNADREAGHSRTGGRPPKKKAAGEPLSADTIADMDEKEFERLQSRVLTSKR